MQKDYLIVDIETGDAVGASLDIEKKYVRKGNTKDEGKISRKQGELKGGCLDLSPIAIVGLKSSASSVPVVLAVNGVSVDGCCVLSYKDELHLLSEAQEVLSDVPREADIVTFAGYGFDLPKLRLAFVRYGLIVPECLIVNRQVDCQHEMSKFLVKNYAFSSLEEACQKVGIEFSKSIPGSEINAYIEAGRMEELIAYNVGDLGATEQLYKRIRGIV
jgi:uncharacterized protein YprB with RNaseH-like and TPR domain